MKLDAYLPKPFTMTCGDWEITSPVPTVHAGKIVTAFQAMQAEQARRIDAGEPLLTEEDVDGIPQTLDELSPIILGETQVDRLLNDGCPPAYVNSAAFAAVIYWANGASEQAVAAYMAGLNTAAEDAQATLDAIYQTAVPKAQTPSPSQTGQPTE